MSALDRATRLLEAAHTPLLLVGARARLAMPVIERLRERLQAPILTTPEAKSQVDERLPESGGVFSFGAHARGQALVARADLILALGTELGEFASRGGCAFQGKSVIQVVDDARELATSLTPDLSWVADLAEASAALAMRVRARPSESAWYEGVRPALFAREATPRTPTPGTITPVAAVAAIAASLPERARIACDVTSATLWLLRDAALGKEQRLWCNLEKSACMGGALPAGIGLALASALPTLVLVGDWGLLMGSSELHTLASLRLPGFVVVVWSNAGGALIRCGVQAQGIAVTSDLHTWQKPIRFAQVARGYGLDAVTVRTALGLRRALQRALHAPHPTLLEALIDPDAAVPAGERYLHLDAAPESAS
jgi:thiamine pyrophosphate-dependent acetolactate synthase large subunit-like protein